MNKLLSFLFLFCFTSSVYASTLPDGIETSDITGALNAFSNTVLDPACRAIGVYKVNEINPTTKKTVNSFTIDTGLSSPYKSFRQLPDGQIEIRYKDDYIGQNKNSPQDAKFWADANVESSPNASIKILTSTVGNNYQLKCQSFCSKAPHPFIAPVVECLEGTLRNLFLKPVRSVSGIEGNNTATLFQMVQGALKPIILLLIILYVVILGFYTLMGKGLHGNTKKDLMFFAFKMALVSYFAVGDAWKDFFYDAIKSISYGASQIILDASLNSTEGNIDGCMFRASFFPKEKGYLALFDTLDCKFGNYIGYFKGFQIPATISVAISYLFFPPLIGLCVSILCVVYFILVVLLYAKMAQAFVSMLIQFALLLFLSPVVIPFVLFDSTKQVYDQWLNKLQNSILPPIGLFLSFSIMMLLFDGIFYGANPAPDLFTETPPVYENFVGISGFVAEEGSNITENIKSQCLAGIFGNALKSNQISYDTENLTLRVFGAPQDYNSFINQYGKNTTINRTANSNKSFDEELRDEVLKLKFFNTLSSPIAQQMTDKLDSLTVDSTQECAGSTLSWVEGSSVKALCLKNVDNFCQTFQSYVLSYVMNEPKYINPYCSSGANVYSSSSWRNMFFRSDISIVCTLINLGGTVTLELPVPGMIVMFEIPLPIRPDLAFMFGLVLIISLFMILSYSQLSAKLQDAITKIFGGSEFNAGKPINPAATAFSAGASLAKKGYSATKDLADNANLNRQKGPEGKPPDDPNGKPPDDPGGKPPDDPGGKPGKPDGGGSGDGGKGA